MNKAINTMNVVDMQNYTTLRDRVRATYKLQPKHYRQIFRKTSKVDNDTYYLFAGNLKLLFEKRLSWCSVTSVNEVKKLMIFE